MRLLMVVFFSLLVSLPPAWCDEGHHHSLTEEEVGSVHFATSCAKTVGLSFNRAVALLHSFQYEQTRQAFAEISVQDPTCAMAEWGIAMSHYHGLWDNGDLEAGRDALNKEPGVAGTNPRIAALVADVYGLERLLGESAHYGLGKSLHQGNGRDLSRRWQV
jgi:hypothetical protein